jgi:hypothetical protein
MISIRVKVIFQDVDCDKVFIGSFDPFIMN